jgi:hypothetical protein
MIHEPRCLPHICELAELRNGGTYYVAIVAANSALNPFRIQNSISDYAGASSDVLFCRQAILSMHSGGCDSNENLFLIDGYPQGNRILYVGFGPSAYGAHLHARRRGKKREAFKYKKGKWLKRLKSLDPKHQFQSVNRHDQSVKRQIVLALLSFTCHASVC